MTGWGRPTGTPRWSALDETRGAALVLSLRTVPDVRSGLLDAVGGDSLLAGSSPVVLAAPEEAVARGEQWVADHDDRGARA